MNRLDEMRLRHLAIFLALALVLWAFLKTAWVAEDAYITFRSIDNLLSGYGLRWNIDERVMVFTHPLWMLLLTPLVALIGDDYTAALLLSGFFTLLSAWILCAKVAQTWRGRIFVGLVLSSSLSFATFSSSGLEGPLLHVMVAGAIWRLSARIRRSDNPNEAGRDGLFWGLWLALSFLARPDAVLIFLPLAVYAGGQCLSDQRWHFVKWGAVGLLPAVAWTVFAVLYFGSPFPNTFYAKVVTGVSSGENLAQGMWYLYETAVRDPAGAIVIMAAVWFGLRSAHWGKPLAWAILAYGGYLLWIGGDFMAGRFTSALVVLSAGGLLAYETVAPKLANTLAWLAGAGALGMLLIHRAPIAMPPDYAEKNLAHGVQDERGAYYQTNGLFGSNRKLGAASSHLYRTGSSTYAVLQQHATENIPDARQRDIIGTVVYCYVGQFGKAVGPHVHVIDPLALTDPFLSHLPGRMAMPGHIVRALPPGYTQAVAFNDPSQLPPAMLGLWKDVVLVYRSNDLFAPERLAAIWRLHTGEGAAAARESGYDQQLAAVSSLDCRPRVVAPFTGILSKEELEQATLRGLLSR